MKASSKFTRAVSAAALTVGLVGPVSGAAFLFSADAAFAAVVSRIEVRGNQRVDDQTIINYTGIRPGQNYGPGDVDQAVKSLYGTGLFSDVSVVQSGSTLVVEVSEYATVNAVIFRGNKKAKDDQLAAAVQLKPRGTFSQAALDQDTEAVREVYSRIGRSDVVVTPQVSEVGNGRVNIVYDIQEGDRTKIARIEFVGNNAYSDRRLRDVISTKKSNILSFLFRNDVYDENRLRADEEALRRFYYNRGYADFQIVSSDGILNEAENEYVVTFAIEEGERYRFGDISIDSTIPELGGQDLLRYVETEQGEVYSAKDVEDSILSLAEAVAGSGYVFAQVNPRGDRDVANRTISVVYTIDQGPRTYVERIEIRGNDRTRDYVIRREFDIAEGDAFNQVLVQRAKRRLEALNFFETVNISTVQGSEPDQVVMVVDVVEKSTGEFTVGGGYSTGGSNSGPSVELSVTERNFLGRGQYIRLAGSGGTNSRDYRISFTEPYFLGRRISAGFDLFRSTTELDDYDTATTGGTVRFGLPITEALSAQIGYTYKIDEYDLDDCSITDSSTGSNTCGLSNFIGRDIARGDWQTSAVTLGLTFNTLDSITSPREGIYAKTEAELAGVGGDASYYKLTARAQYFALLNEEYDLAFVGTVGGGYVDSWGDEELRTFDLFRSNDRLIRGFEYNGIGPVDSGDHLGYQAYANASAEVTFPMPVLPESLGFRGAVFSDVATVGGTPFDDVNESDGIRASVGVGIQWASPFGPLRVNYAEPIVKKDEDEVQRFSFGIGSQF
ncbi:outer membrane protein assembly factor BamA [Notoacmeibacter ruber]|uniref:Outer membrane protein assembly factor BamA n=1 Tax=Notoacmeibacter ruber TaxID=2670375 RepID=A0A3L7JBF7_9HYPH|nr:outer membrane protein assembly factor BamA [Notoacmeibacter ruber]RLQ87973.1 outer membrane protein assembly factor BamA [Notoacmeibacter ruber]